MYIWNLLKHLALLLTSVGSVRCWLWSSNNPLHLRGYFLLCPSPEQQGFLLRHFNDGESGKKPTVWLITELNLTLGCLIRRSYFSCFRCVWCPPRCATCLVVITLD